MVVFRPDTSPPLRVLSIYCIGTPIHLLLSTAFSSKIRRRKEAGHRFWVFSKQGCLMRNG
ncbi:hypothetical protein LINGRAHAP2_LOCUS7390, partial [Linum grandiflorum]